MVGSKRNKMLKRGNRYMGVWYMICVCLKICTIKSQVSFILESESYNTFISFFQLKFKICVYFVYIHTCVHMHTHIFSSCDRLIKQLSMSNLLKITHIYWVYSMDYALCLDLTMQYSFNVCSKNFVLGLVIPTS